MRRSAAHRVASLWKCSSCVLMLQNGFRFLKFLFSRCIKGLNLGPGQVSSSLAQKFAKKIQKLKKNFFWWSVVVRGSPLKNGKIFFKNFLKRHIYEPRSMFGPSFMVIGQVVQKVWRVQKTSFWNDFDTIFACLWAKAHKHAHENETLTTFELVPRSWQEPLAIQVQCPNGLWPKL